MRMTLVLAAVMVASVCLADEPKNNLLEPKLKEVAIFQDGFGYFVREGKVKLEDGWATAKSIPSAVRGTIWVYTVDGSDSIETLLSVKTNVIEAKGADEIKKALENMIGQQLTIRSGNKDFSGKLSKLLDDMLLLDVGGAYTAINYSSIQKITLPGYPLKILVDTEDKGKVTTIGMACIQEGVRWEPSYVLNLNGSDRGVLVLRGNILNLPESLSGTDVRFVVGSPQLSNRGQAETFKAGPEPAEVVPPTPAEEAAPAPETHTFVAAPPPSLTSDASGELFYYTKPGFTMEKSDIAMVTIFEHTVPIQPLYTWLADGDEVNYILKIENRSGQPFTEGPVFVVEDGKPLGQETIKYTPGGATAELRLARGIGLKTEKTDVETGRGKVITIGKTQFLPIEMKGTLKVTNFRNVAAPIKITRTVRGKVLKITGNGAVKDTQVFTGDPNAVYKIEWETTVPANGVLTVQYEYETYTAVASLDGPPVPSGPEGF
jgi:hypothetical protein